MVRPQRYREVWGSPDRTMRVVVPRHGQMSAGIIRQLIEVFDDVPDKWR